MWWYIVFKEQWYLWLQGWVHFILWKGLWRSKTRRLWCCSRPHFLLSLNYQESASCPSLTPQTAFLKITHGPLNLTRHSLFLSLSPLTIWTNSHFAFLFGSFFPLDSRTLLIWPCLVTGLAFHLQVTLPHESLSQDCGLGPSSPALCFFLSFFF